MNSQDAHSFYDPLVQGSSCSTPQFHASEKNKLFWGWVHVPHSCSSRRFGTVRPVFNQQSEGWSCGFEDREGGEEKKKKKRDAHISFSVLSGHSSHNNPNQEKVAQSHRQDCSRWHFTALNDKRNAPIGDCGSAWCCFLILKWFKSALVHYDSR